MKKLTLAAHLEERRQAMQPKDRDTVDAQLARIEALLKQILEQLNAKP